MEIENIENIKNIEKIKHPSLYESFNLKKISNLEDNIEDLIQVRTSFKNYPLEPLYMASKNLDVELKSQILPLMSITQRKAIWHLDFWTRDEINPINVNSWFLANCMTKDSSIKEEFFLSDEFALYIKSTFNIKTFDIEDPLYPDHDNYFLSEGNLLLFEYSEENTSLALSLKKYLVELYSFLGLERAYTHIFKIISTSYLIEQENLYNQKSSLLEDYGFMNHFKALEFLAPLDSKTLKLQNFNKYKSSTPKLSSQLKMQTLASRQLTTFEKAIVINDEMLNVSNNRLNYLKFNFIQTLNASLILKGNIDLNRRDLLKNNKRAKYYISLGLEYLKQNNSNVLNDFDFSFCYKLGLSLIRDLQHKINFIFKQHSFDLRQDISFLGDFIVNSYQTIFTYKHVEIEKDFLKYYLKHIEFYKFLKDFAPILKEYKDGFRQNIEKSNIVDGYYLNYNIADITIESIMITSIFNYALRKSSVKTLAISCNDYLDIYKVYFASQNSNKSLQSLINSFIEHNNWNNIFNIQKYMTALIVNNVDDKISNISQNLKYVRGIILLN